MVQATELDIAFGRAKIKALSDVVGNTAGERLAVVFDLYLASVECFVEMMVHIGSCVVAEVGLLHSATTDSNRI